MRGITGRICLELVVGKTAKDWREENPEKDGNIRDYASIEQLVVLSNMESLNSVLLNQGIGVGERFNLLNKTAVEQIRILISNNLSRKLLKN